MACAQAEPQAEAAGEPTIDVKAGRLLSNAAVLTSMEQYRDAIKYYREAIEKFDAAFAAHPSPETTGRSLRGLGKAHQRLGNKLQAAKFFRRYLAYAAPQERAELEDLIAELQRD